MSANSCRTLNHQPNSPLNQQARPLGRPIHLEQHTPRPLLMRHLHPTRSRPSHTPYIPHNSGRLDLDGRAVDEALDEAIALGGGDGHFLVAEGDGLSYLGEEALECEVCEWRRRQQGMARQRELSSGNAQMTGLEVELERMLCVPIPRGEGEGVEPLR